MKKIYLFLGAKGLFVLFILLFVLLFCVQNSDPISVRFIFWELLAIPKLVLVLVSIVLGMILGAMLTLRVKKQLSKPSI